MAAVVRCFGSTTETESEFLLLYLRTFAYCVIETLSLLLCIATSSIVLALPPSRWSDLRLVPLTFFYSSLPTILFLTITSIIWRAEYVPSPASSSFSSPALPPFLSALTTRLDALYRVHAPSATAATGQSRVLRYAASLSRANLRSPLAEVGAARGWAGEAVLRKWVGGSSALG
ncbi:hypothetical protein JCM10449v2_007648 [Rhodotorula kratochvilovae]